MTFAAREREKGFVRGRGRETEIARLLVRQYA